MVRVESGGVLGFVVVVAGFAGLVLAGRLGDVVRVGLGVPAGVLSSACGSAVSSVASGSGASGGGVASVGAGGAAVVAVTVVGAATVGETEAATVLLAGSYDEGAADDGGAVGSLVSNRREPTLVAGPRSPRASSRTLAAPAALAASATTPAVATPTNSFLMPTTPRYA